MKPLGIISGTVPLHGKGIFVGLREERVETDFGSATLFRSESVVLIARHGVDPDHHILPHRINHQANISAMKRFEVREIFGAYSSGSLKRHLTPGLLVVPDDYMLPSGGPTIADGKQLHIVPALSVEVRRRWLEAAGGCNLDCVDGGIYWQTTGPRFETKAEIAMMAQFADLVGMTMASEAIVAQELGIPFAAICSVDNYANGLEEKALSMEEILPRARQNAEAILRILTFIAGRVGKG